MYLEEKKFLEFDLKMWRWGETISTHGLFYTYQKLSFSTIGFFYTYFFSSKNFLHLFLKKGVEKNQVLEKPEKKTFLQLIL